MKVVSNPSQFPKLHGNKKIRNLITGQEKFMTVSQWKKAASESARRLVRAFSSEKP